MVNRKPPAPDPIATTRDVVDPHGHRWVEGRIGKPRKIVNSAGNLEEVVKFVFCLRFDPDGELALITLQNRQQRTVLRWSNANDEVPGYSAADYLKTLRSRTASLQYLPDVMERLLKEFPTHPVQPVVEVQFRAPHLFQGCVFGHRFSVAAENGVVTEVSYRRTSGKVLVQAKNFVYARDLAPGAWARRAIDAIEEEFKRAA